MYSGVGEKRESLECSEPAGEPGALQRPGSIASPTPSTGHEPERLLRTKSAHLLECSNLAPADVVNKIARAAQLDPSPANVSTLLCDLSRRVEPKDNVSLDRALRLENKCLTRARSPRRSKPTHAFRIVDSLHKNSGPLDATLRLEKKCLTSESSPSRSKPRIADSSYLSAKRSNDIGNVKSAFSLALSEDDLDFWGPESDSDIGCDDSSAQLPVTRFLLQVQTPRSLRCTKFKSLLQPVQEYEEE